MELTDEPPAGSVQPADRHDRGVPVAEAVYATLHTNAGPIRLELFPNQAPKTVRNFVELAEGTRAYVDPRTGQPGSGPYYDGTISHRVISGFMIQMGDPTGTGRGGPGYEFADEFHPELRFDRPYLLAMANAGPGTNGSQFFITVGPTPHLNNRHTIFGQVADEDSVKVIDAIANTPTNPADRPLNDVVIERVEIERRDS
jgi:peptidyl-prolyl cis-trans isomerase A (cyclophilin A)